MSTEFWNAIREGDLGTAWVRLGGLETVNGKEPESGNTPLHFCALNGETALCMMLYMRGALVQCVNNDNETPLHCAATMGNYQLCCFLLKAGADPQAKDNNGKLPADNVPTQEENTRKILNVGRTHPHLAKELASTLSAKRELPSEAHFKKLSKLEGMVRKQQEDKDRLDQQIADLEATSTALPPKEYKKTLERLQKKRSQLDSEFENNVGSLASRKNKRKLSFLSLFI